MTRSLKAEFAVNRKEENRVSAHLNAGTPMNSHWWEFLAQFSDRHECCFTAAKWDTFSSRQHQENLADQFQYNTYLERVRHICLFFFLI